MGLLYVGYPSATHRRFKCFDRSEHPFRTLQLFVLKLAMGIRIRATEDS